MNIYNIIYCIDFYRKHFILIFILLCCVNGHIYSQSKVDSISKPGNLSISVQGGFNSLTALYFIPGTQGISFGFNVERNIGSQHYIGLDYLQGSTINLLESYMHLKLKTFQFYYFNQSHRLQIINQVGICHTSFEYMDYTDYSTFGDRYNSVGIVLGNNNIHIFKSIPRVKFGIQSNIGIYFHGFSNYGPQSYWFFQTDKYGVPFSFTYFTFKFLFFNPKRCNSN
jgi:hypothetical protein